MAPCPSGGDGRRSPRRSAPTKNTIELSSAAPPYAGDSIAIPVLHAPRRATRARAQSAVESSSARSRASGGFATAAWTHQHLKRYVLRTVLLGTLIALTPLVTSARAATITVNTTADSSTSTSDCTLRDAITAANTDAAVTNSGCTPGDASPTVDVIRFSLPAHSAIDLASELGHINADVNIVGPGSDQLDVHRAGGGNYRVFTIDAGTVSISGLTISNGASTGHAGGIQNGGASTLKLVRVDVTHNTVNTPGSGISNGGGVSNYGTLTVDRSAVTDNAVNASTNMFGAVSNGGGIYNAGGTLTVDRTTVSGNSVNATQGNPTSVAAGGGIYNNGSATTTIRRSTVSANTANASGASASNNNQASGGGIDGGGSFQLDRVTVSGNSATAPPGGLTQGGGVDSSSLGSMTVRSSTLTANAAALGANFLDENSNGSFARTIVSNPKDGGGNCSIVSSTSNGYNLEDDPGPTPSCGFTEATDQSGVNPELGPLKNNGGPTKTHALLSGSPAIDRVPATGFACAASDQRGYRRPDNGEARCDIGAYEFQDPPDTKITKATIKRRKRRAKFSFKAIGIASGFQCALVRRNKKHHKQPKPSFAACSSPKKYKHLKSGSYKFEVRAVSTAGADPTPAIKKFKV